MGLIQLIGVFLFSAAAAMVVAGFQRVRQRQSAPAPFQTPLVPAGTKIPVLYGTWRVRPIVTWFGGATTHEVVTYQTPLLLGFIHFAPTQAIPSGYEYGITMQGLLCWGPAQVFNMVFGENRLLTNQATTQIVSDPTGTAHVTVSSVSGGGFIGFGALDLEVYSGGRGSNTFFLPNVLGGPGRGGGVKGAITFAKGSRQYGPDALMVAKLGAANVPSYADFATVVYDDLIIGESPTPPAIDYILRGKGGSVNDRLIGPAGKQWLVQDTSAAAILLDALRNPWYGLGEPEWKVNQASFDSAHAQLATEKMGMSLYAGGSSGPQINSFQDLRQECERHAGGMLRRNAETFQWEFVLLRDESAHRADLPFYDERHFDTFEWNRTDPKEVINRVTVEFSDAEQLYQTDTVTLTNDANVAMTRGVRATKVQYLGCTDRAIAWKLCARELTQQSTPLSRGKGNAIRALWSALPGDVIRLSNDRHEVDDVMVRVLSVDLGLPEDPFIAVTFVEDVFSQPTVDRVAYPDPPAPTPTAITRPTITAMKQTVAAGVGTLDFTVLDPEHRITSIDVMTKSGTAAPSAWTNIASASPDPTDPSFPYNDHVTDGDLNATYTVTVPLSAFAESGIAIRVQYVGYSTIDDPTADIQEVLSPVVIFPLLRRVGVPALSFVYSGSDVIVTAYAPDATSVKIAANLGSEPTDAAIRAATADSAAPFMATFPAPIAGQVLYVGSFAYEGTDESARSPTLTISGGAPSGTLGSTPVTIPKDDGSGFVFVFDPDGNQIFI